ncbi:MAG: lysophospholipid acyltransferase family protein [Pseudomonadota bacterium]
MTTPTWDGPPPPEPPARGPVGLLRVIYRGLPMALVVSGGLVVLLALRLVERPLFGTARPWTPFITQGVCRAAIFLLGIRLRVHGHAVPRVPLVANHSSWVDIFALNAAARVYFVAKAEVAGWAGIGWLARATGTVFVRRVRGDAARQRAELAARLAAGHALLFFPEGTSTDGRRVLAFKPTLFAALYDQEDGQVQPVCVVYKSPPGEDARVFGWWGNMDFGPHLLALLAAPGGGTVDLIFQAPLHVSEYADRKALAKAAEAAVRRAFLERVPDP